MTRTIKPTDASDIRGGYAVRRPRASDAIGKALRGAFSDDHTLPCDIAAALSHLDRVPI